MPGVRAASTCEKLATVAGLKEPESIRLIDAPTSRLRCCSPVAEMVIWSRFVAATLSAKLAVTVPAAVTVTVATPCAKPRRIARTV